MRFIDLIIRVAVVLQLIEILGIVVFYTTSYEVARCRAWNGDYNIAYQRCDPPTHARVTLFK